MSREWMRRLRRASYRGVSFWVESDDVETGQRLVVHQFPKRDVPFIEPMGLEANRISVTAYMVGADSDSRQLALMTACGVSGAARLSLPTDRFMVQCQSCNRTYERDRMGFIAFDLEFVRDDGGVAGPIPIGYLAAQTSTAISSVLAAATNGFVSRFSTLGLPGYVRSAALASIRSVAVEIEAVRSLLPLGSTALPAVALRIADLAQNAEDYSYVGKTGDRFTLSSFVSNQETSNETGYVSEVFGILDDMRTNADPTSVTDEFRPMLEYGISTAYRETTAGTRQIATNDRAAAMVLRLGAIAHFAAAMVDRDIRDRREAIQARADVAEFVDAEMKRLEGPDDHAAFLALAELRGHAINYLSRLHADLIPIVSVESQTSKPSLWWANVLYGDANRAEDLARRNRVKHPGFMPLSFEAEAR